MVFSGVMSPKEVLEYFSKRKEVFRIDLRKYEGLTNKYNWAKQVVV